MSVDVPDAKRTRYGTVADANAALNVTVALWPSAPVAVAVKLAVREAGNEKESLIFPSTPATRSAVWVHASLLSSSTTTCTVEPGVQFAPLR